MKESISQIIGKTISSIVCVERSSGPKKQAFVVFEDGTSFEFWGDSFTWASGVDNEAEDAVLRHISNNPANLVRVFHKSDGAITANEGLRSDNDIG